MYDLDETTMDNFSIDDIAVNIGTMRSTYSNPGFVELGGTVNVLTADDGEPPKIGTVGAYLINDARLDMSFYEQCDSVSGNLEAIAADVCGDDLHFDHEFLGVMSDSPILILDTIELDEQHRGKGYGPRVAQLAIEAVIGCHLVLCTPSPMGDPQYGKTHAEAVAALGRTWATIGFVQLTRGNKNLGTWVLDPYDLKPVSVGI